MAKVSSLPGALGQLVWCPSDPSLGVGVVTRTGQTEIRVRFLRLQEDRTYTTRAAPDVIVRYQITSGDRVRHLQRENLRVVRVAAHDGPLLVYELEDGT